ncbi:CehA/McbA family metallohydrolase [Luteibacter rhizovicinus]|nr:CehA/McbA family metallohydrolase [Luteibacter rhizovicinus]
MKHWFCIALIGFASMSIHAEVRPDAVLHGELSGKDNRTYREVPFDVPEGTSRITIDVDYTGRDERTTIDIGLLGPGGFAGQDGFRGWSGGSKRVFTVSATDATASFLPGAIRAGRWTLLLGIPNIRPPSHATYTARVWFGTDTHEPWGPADPLTPPLRREAGWYRGDLHMHTAHSDGGCPTQSGAAKVPCPLFLTVAKAAQRGLDFIAISDHNTMSQVSEMRELQPYFDRMLLMPAREITTFQGHANLFGVSRPVDFRVGSAAVPDWNALLGDVAKAGGLISINHPKRPNDETCMGCGWTPERPVDMDRIQAVEAVNGSDVGGASSGIPFWEAQLDAGHRPTAIGGSDSHDAGSIGTPTTVVRAGDLSMPAVLDGIRAGHVFVDIEGAADRMLDLRTVAAGKTISMGDEVAVKPGSVLRFVVHTEGVAGSRVELIDNGRALATPMNTAVQGSRDDRTVDWTADGKPHWIRANVRAADGRLLLLGNPIYVNRSMSR